MTDREPTREEADRMVEVEAEVRDNDRRATPDPAVEAAVRQIIADYALGTESVHMNWRCGYPDTYGPCGCVDEFVKDAVLALEPLIRAREKAAWERLCKWLDAHVDSDVRESVKRAARDSNPYETGEDQ